MSKYYILINGEIIESDLRTMGIFFEDDNARRIAFDKIEEATISTVFLCIDHSFTEEGPPILFETMVFGGENDQFQDRYSTLEEAKNGHKVVVNAIKKGEKLE